jgi:alanine dehydrogenase
MRHISFISAEQIREACVPLKTVYDLVLKGFRLHGLGLYENPPKQGIHTRHGAFLNAMPIYLP